MQQDKVTEATTRHLYTEEYFEGDRSKSNYSGYSEASFGPSQMLADTLYRFFRPLDAIDVGCAVGHGVKRLVELGVDAYGVDISDWAVAQAETPRVRQSDFSEVILPAQYDLVFSYDVVEHVRPERLSFAISNLWQATRRDLLVVPATYENGETYDPDEPTHLVLESY